MLLLIDERWEDRPAERPAWVELKIWLLSQAACWSSDPQPARHEHHQLPPAGKPVAGPAR
ncbi:hypothetical protein [Couchioplanes caeruleus]|uniref:hypothetical protein n=1 Tax=Couchioplanes caeruleus TaxID=56438 RepID=UPI0011603C1A|nr:hypothetical protein [Couchioplanes caeruleus]